MRFASIRDFRVDASSVLLKAGRESSGSSSTTLNSCSRTIPLPRRHAATGRGGSLPDKITLFRNSLQKVSRDRKDLVRRIRKTLLHEIGHYFGISDKDLRAMGY